MTVSSTAARIDYAGAGSVGPYPFPFRILDDDELDVVRVTTTGLELQEAKVVDYTVSGVGDRNGGSITLNQPLAAGESLVIRRSVPLSQPTSFRNLGSFDAAAHEDAFDRLTMAQQQRDEQLQRSFRLRRRYQAANFGLELDPAANQVLAWRSDGLGLESRAVDSTAAVLPGDGRTVTSHTAYLANNAVFNPLDFGAVGDGVTDDKVALQLCLDKAKLWAVALPIFRRPVIDMRGRCYATSVQIEIPGGGHGYLIRNFILKPTGAFDDTMYLLACGRLADASLPDGFKINNLVVEDGYFTNVHATSGNHVGGGILIQRYLRAWVSRCIFQAYHTHGVITKVDGHELFIRECQFGEYFWADPMPPSSPNAGQPGQNFANEYVDTGIRFETNDNYVLDCVIQLCRYGIYFVNSDANIIRGVHCWPGYVKTAGTSGATSALDWMNTCMYVDQNSLLNNITDCYFDGGDLVVENPWKFSLTNSVFLHGWGDAARGMIKFIPKIAGEFLDGVQITGNVFAVLNAGASMKGMAFDFSGGGSWSAGNIRRCRWLDNSFTAVTKFQSEAQLSLSQSPGQDWAFDLYQSGAGLFPINVIQMMRYNAYQFSGGTAHFRATALSSGQVTISAFSDAAIGTKQSVNATVYLWATMNRSDDA